MMSGIFSKSGWSGKYAQARMQQRIRQERFDNMEDELPLKEKLEAQRWWEKYRHEIKKKRRKKAKTLKLIKR